MTRYMNHGEVHFEEKGNFNHMYDGLSCIFYDRMFKGEKK